jgi:hypothetical protein
MVDAPRLCECGCGGHPKTPGARFLPGHHGRVAPRAADGKLLAIYQPRTCDCGCGGHPKSHRSRFLPGHNMRPRGIPLTIRCRRCGHEQHYRPSHLKYVKSYDRKTGTYLCSPCQAHDRTRIATAALLAKRGVGSKDVPEVRQEALRDVADHMVRVAGGRQNVIAMMRASQGRHTEKGRVRRSIHQWVNGRRAGRFQLCRGCSKLIYLPPARLRPKLRRPALGFHDNCYREFQQTNEYKLWRQQVGSLKSPMLHFRLTRYPHPLPPRPPGRRPTFEQLESRFRWLLRHYLLRESWAEIAAKDGYERSTIAKGVASLIDILPDSWRKVFGKPTSLDKLLPIDRLRPPRNA